MKHDRKRTKFDTKPGKALVGYLFAGAFTKMIGILTTPLFTRLLGGEEYGKLAFFLSSSGVISGIISPLVSGSQIYGILNQSEDNINKIFLSGLLPISGICGALGILLFTLGLFFEEYLGFAVLLSLQIFFDSSVLFYLTLKRYEYKSRTVMLITLSEGVFSPLISVFLIKTIGASYFSRVIGLLLPPAIITAVIVVKALLSKEKISPGISGALLKKSLPLLPVSVLGALGLQSDRLLTAFLLGNLAIGKYSVAHSLGVGLLFAVSAICSAFIPWMIRRLDSDKKEDIYTVSRQIITGLVSLSIFVIALSPEAMLILAPPEYYEALPAVMPIAMSSAFSFISSISTAALIHRDAGREIFLCKLFSLLSGIFSGLIFIPLFGYFGAGLGVFITEGVSAVMSYRFLKKKENGTAPHGYGSLPAVLCLSMLAVLLPLLHGNLPLRILSLIIPSVIALNVMFSGRIPTVYREDQKNIPHL